MGTLSGDNHDKKSRRRSIQIWNVSVGSGPISSLSFIQPFIAGIIFLILAHPVYEIWIKQEPNTLELWNKLHFEEEKTDSIYNV